MMTATATATTITAVMESNRHRSGNKSASKQNWRTSSTREEHHKKSLVDVTMFATENYVQSRKGDRGTSRFDYLQQLVTEYQDTTKQGTWILWPFIVESKRQIIANLANFAYDPYNYAILNELNVVGIFNLNWPASLTSFWMVLVMKMS